MKVNPIHYLLVSSLLAVPSAFFAFNGATPVSLNLFSLLLSTFFIFESYTVISLKNREEGALALGRASVISFLHNFYFDNIFSLLLGVGQLFLVFYFLLAISKRWQQKEEK